MKIQYFKICNVCPFAFHLWQYKISISRQTVGGMEGRRDYDFFFTFVCDFQFDLDVYQGYERKQANLVV